MKDFKRNPLINNALHLGLIIGMCAIALVIINQLTLPSIKQAQMHYETQTLQAVFPTTKPIEIIQDSASSWRVCTNSTLMGRIDKLITTEGYSGNIVFLAGTDLNKQIQAIRVLQHKETPGLGDKIERRKSAWIDQFMQSGFSSIQEDNWKTQKEGGHFDQLTGASITSKAIINRLKIHLQDLPSLTASLCHE